MKKLGMLAPVLMLLFAAGVPVQAAEPSIEGVPRFGNVFVVVGENTELVQINHNSMPYLVDTLVPQSAFLNKFYAVTHFSTGNYVGMTSGQYTPCEQFDKKPAECHQDIDNIFSQLTEAGASWTAWNESMPEPCYLTNSGTSKTLNSYAVKHNPAVYYDNVEGAGGVWSATDRSDLCMDSVLPTGGTGPNDTSALDAALASGDVADFNYIVPNMCEDAHDQCPGSRGNPLNQFDDFLAREIPKILASPAFGSDGVLIVTFDEGTSTTGGSPSNTSTPCKAWVTCPHPFNGGGNIAFLVISPLVDVGVSHERADLYSMLRTLEDGFGITDYLGAADDARAIDEIWS
jgi:hypothetical protein